MPLRQKNRCREVELLFGVLHDDRGKHEAAWDEDLAEEGILVTNLSVWLPNPAVIQENRSRPERSWLGTKFLQCPVMSL